MIETNRLFLNKPQTKDRLELIKLWQDREVQKYLGGPLSEQLAEERLSTVFHHWEKHDVGLCAVVEKSSQALIGLCGLQFSEDGIELSYKFHTEFWGKGFAYESAKAVLAYGLKILKTDQIIAITQRQNEHSKNLLVKIGMRYVREFRRYNSTQNLFRITIDANVKDVPAPEAAMTAC